jgi:hypothetical protein
MMLLPSVVLGCGRVCRRYDASPLCVGSYYESKIRRKRHVQVAESVFAAQSLTVVFRIGIPSTGMSQSFCLLPAKMCKFRPQFTPVRMPASLLLMPRDTAPIIRMVAQVSRGPHPGRQRWPALTGSQGSGHELALLYGGRCHQLVPRNDDLGAQVAAAEL